MNKTNGWCDRGLVILVPLCVAVVAVVATPAFAQADEKKKAEAELSENEKARSLPLRWQVWLNEEVYPLITKEQRQAFLSLETEAQRKAFVERLWILWARTSGYGSAFRGIYEDRLAMARYEFGNTSEERARILLIHGPPPGRHGDPIGYDYQPAQNASRQLVLSRVATLMMPAML